MMASCLKTNLNIIVKRNKLNTCDKTKFYMVKLNKIMDIH